MTEPGIGQRAELPDFGELLDRQPYPLLFVTVSGAHLYGFPSPDSDYDLRGVHLLPAEAVLGLDVRDETLEFSGRSCGVEMDFVTHDLLKFARMLLKKNGYVLEQLFSPLVVRGSAAHEELKRIAARCITRHHVHHYLGFARHQWELFSRAERPRVKPLLYVYRILLTGIHLMRTGQVEANLVTLNRQFRLGSVEGLIAAKMGGAEQQMLASADVEQHRGEYERLLAELQAAHETSPLPEGPEAREELSALIVRLRSSGLGT